MVRQSILLTVLALCVVSSKHILIYNEELLVLLSFVAFVVFCSHTMSETVHSTFQARSAAIEQELQAYLKLQEEYAQDLVSEHTNHLALSTVVHQVGVFTCAELATSSCDLQAVFNHRVHSIVKKVHMEHQLFLLTTQTRLAKGLRGLVFDQKQRLQLSHVPTLA